MPIRSFAAAAVVIAVAVALPATATAAERTVSVTATATLKVPNSAARASFSVSRERRHRGAALQAASKGLKRVIAAVRGVPGVGDGDVRTGRISVRKLDRGARTTYRAAEGIAVVLHQPAKAGELVAAALAAGASGVTGPSFFVGDAEAAYARALAAAFEKAKARASLLAAEAGASHRAALSIQEGGEAEVFAPQPSEKAAPACGPEPGPIAKRCTGTTPPTKPGTSTVTATVGVVFALL
jgi:uncharacterized protein YggE